MLELPSADRLNRYKLIRDEISHEDNLIAARLSWFMAAQSFLLSALAIAQGQQRGMPRMSTNYLFPLTPLVGLISSVLIFVGVLAGIRALQSWRRIMEDHAADFAEFPRIKRDGWIIGCGWSAPIGLPLVFLVAWTYLLAAGLMAAD